MTEQWHFDPDSYLEMARGEIKSYDRLEELLAESTRDVDARTILDLGSGTGVTAAAVLARHPGARLVGIDGSETMLGHARELVPDAEFRVGRLEDPLPDGPFDLVVSALAIHHLEAPDKADLFRRVADALAPGGRFVLFDVVLAEHAVGEQVPLDHGHDKPSTIADQTAWLEAAGLVLGTVVAEDDLWIVTADRPDDSAN